MHGKRRRKSPIMKMSEDKKERLIKKLKKDPDVDNPWALANYIA